MYYVVITFLVQRHPDIPVKDGVCTRSLCRMAVVLTSLVAQDAYAISRWPQAKMPLDLGPKGRGSESVAIFGNTL